MYCPNPCRSWKVLCLVALLVSFAGCGDDTLAPFEPEITNAEAFQMQATGVDGVTFHATYSWANPGTQATVNHSTTTTAGAADVRIRDAAGTVVYDETLAPSLNETTAAGTSGAWTIEVTLTGYRGTLNFRVERI